jgi:phosphatidylserine/phosphatidylglycerophosphate/cardiolipin synthase-like enzyme
MAKTDYPYLRVARNPQLTLHGFKLDDLAPYKRAKQFDPRDSEDYRQFYVGRDDVHGVLKYLLSRCSSSLRFNMFGYDDDELDAIIQHLVKDVHVYVQGTLDKSQAGGVHEKKILSTWTAQMHSSFAIRRSPTGQIAHTKGGVVDNLVSFEGSTNWSATGEGTDPKHAQNNTLVIATNPVELAQFTDELDYEHTATLHGGTVR